MNKTKLFPVIFVFLLSIFSGCASDDDQNLIPYVRVNFTINPESIEYGELNVPGNWVYVTGGYRGIIIYNLYDQQYMAFERCCTFDPENDCARVSVIDGGLVAIDSCCMSQFVLTDGSPLEGSKATIPLRQYNTNLDPSTGLLHVYN